MLTLTNIQDNVPKDIWLQGKHLLSLPDLVNVKQLTPTEWVGFVCTTEKHKITVHQNEEEIIDWQCDCNHGNEICEHVVAVLYAIRNELHHISPYPSLYTETLKEKDDDFPVDYDDRPFIKKNIQSMLDCWPAEEIISFLGQYASTHPDCEAALLDEFLTPLLNTPDTNYRERTRQCFEWPSKRGESLEKYTPKQWHRVYDNLIEILASARELALNNSFMDAADIALEIVDYVAVHLDEIPDRQWIDENDFFEIFEDVADVLIKVLVDPLTPKEVSEKIFREMSDAETMELFVDDGIYIPILQVAFMACELTQTPEEVLNFIERTIDTIDVELMQPSMITKQVFLLRTFGREKEAEKILEKYLDVDEVRGAEVKYQMSCGNFDKALQLVNEVIDKPQPSLLPFAWEKMQLEIYEDTNNIEGLIDYYKRQVPKKTGGLKAFDKLKELVSPDQLRVIVKELLPQIKLMPARYEGTNMVADILGFAGMCDELLEFLESQTKNRLHFLTRYAFYFRGDNMEKLKPVLVKEIYKQVNNSDRKNSYEAIKDALELLRVIVEWQGFAEEIIDKLKADYPTRASLLRMLDAI